MTEKNFERELPEGYREVVHLNAKSAKMGILFNLAAFGVLAIVMIIAVIPLFADKNLSFSIDLYESRTALYIFCFVSLIYIVLHELVHGVAYKSLTGEKLTFGLSWSCAFCGVPDIYTYRKAAVISCASPLIVFSVVFGVSTAILYFVNPVYYLLSAVLFGIHLGGCSGDIYVIYLLAKLKNPKALMRDTGPEQWIYIPDTQN